MSPPHITWMTPEKQMGWLDGSGPMTDFAIYAILRDEGNMDNYTEEISNTMKKMSGAFDIAWALLKSDAYGRPPFRAGSVEGGFGRPRYDGFGVSPSERKKFLEALKDSYGKPPRTVQEVMNTYPSA
jgi:hypothetical protein